MSLNGWSATARSGVSLFNEVVMQLTQTYAGETTTRGEVDALPGVTVIEFGTPWCGYCQIAQPILAQAF